MARRRTNEEIRTLIIDAARDLFRAQGYAATTTKQIANQAGVLEPLVFRNFESKAKLFDDAVAMPFVRLIDAYVAGWGQPDTHATPDERIEAFIEGFFDLARQHRRVLLDAVAQRQMGTSPDEDVLDHIARALHKIAGVNAISTDYPAMDPSAAVSSTMGMVLGAALLDDLLYERGKRRPSRARIMAELSGTMLYGVNRSPSGPRES